MNNARREQIKCDLRTKNLSFSRLSQISGIDPSVFSAVCAGRKRSRRVARLIAQALGTTPEALWPEVYGDQND
ncbi:helix-turn-helix domain-containing protein [Paracoccus versutus]|uniref:helix-turn-helix domain-containing protein n=1 Tax=Paracoccus versutus TaxID=34007 RepID=UPI003C7C59AC